MKTAEGEAERRSVHALSDNDEVFTLRARICKRCGRILTRKESVERGYGCQCAKREEAKARELAPIPGQIDIYEWMDRWK